MKVLRTIVGQLALLAVVGLIADCSSIGFAAEMSFDANPPPLFGLEVAEPSSRAGVAPADVDTFFNQGESAPANPSNVLATPFGWDFNFFPNTLLWEPPLASKREPRMQGLPVTLKNYDNNSSLDTSIGTTVGLLRATPASRPDWEFQWDIFAVVHTRLSPQDLIATDYRFGIPLSIQHGEWHVKFSYEHTSAHLGDEAMYLNNLFLNYYANDEVVFAVDRYFGNFIRPYAQAGFAFMHSLPDESYSRWRYDLGMEIFDRTAMGVKGTPYAATHCELRGELDFNANWNFQLGWRWHNSERRLANGRVFAEYYTGRSPYGQFYRTEESFFGLGFAFDS